MNNMKKLINDILDALFGCPHPRTSFPQSPRRSNSLAAVRPPHVVCLACGREFAYDWDKMRVAEPVSRGKVTSPQLQGRTAVQ
jgi:hypothetical protein